MKLFYFSALALLFIFPVNNIVSQGTWRNSRSDISGQPQTQKVHKVNMPASAIVMNFDSLAAFSLTFGNWTTADLDRKPTYTIQDHTFPNNGDTMSFISFDPAQVVPSMASDPEIQPHSGTQFGACFSATTPPNNDWFISPRIQLKNNGTFSFWVKSYTSQYGLERYKVAVSATDNDPSSFTVISGLVPLEAPVIWQKQTFSLASYNNQQVYVAIQCVSNDAFLFMIDDLAVDPGTDSTGGLPSSISQDFESVPDFTLVFDPWKTVDVRGGLTYSINGCVFPNNGLPMAWINFVPSMAVPPPANMTTHSGSKMAACFSSMPPNNPNDKWLITPHMHLGNNGKLSLWVMTYNVVYGLEKYNVCVSTSGSDPSDFTVIAPSETAPMDWTEKIYNLSSYAGQDVYIGIECISSDQFIMLLDDIQVTSVTGINEDLNNESITLFPNPASGNTLLRLNFASGRNGVVTLFNILGSPVRSYPLNIAGEGSANLDLAGIAKGSYFVVYSDDNRKVTAKLVVN